MFETLDDLDNSTATMQKLLSCEWYCQHINGEQEVMIGYSDSGKDAGRLAAAWGLYEVQESLVRVAMVSVSYYCSQIGPGYWRLMSARRLELKDYVLSMHGTMLQAHVMSWQCLCRRTTSS